MILHKNNVNKNKKCIDIWMNVWYNLGVRKPKGRKKGYE